MPWQYSCLLKRLNITNCTEEPKYSERAKETKANAFHQDLLSCRLWKNGGFKKKEIGVMNKQRFVQMTTERQLEEIFSSFLLIICI